MLFWLKKLVSFWLMPLPLCVALLAAGWWLTRSKRKGTCRLVTAGLLLLLIFSNRAVSKWLVRPLESRYPAIPELRIGGAPPAALSGCRYIVVLGGGHSDVEGRSATDKLSSAARGRLMEGVRLAYALPAAQLIVSGPAESDDSAHATHASVLTAAAESLGIASSRIIRIDTARDTDDESRAVKAIVGPARVVLITSAWHMPRAAGLFRHAGVDFVAGPADYTGDNVEWPDFLWDAESLGRSTEAVHEFIGYAWLRLQGKL